MAVFVLAVLCPTDVSADVCSLYRNVKTVEENYDENVLQEVHKLLADDPKELRWKNKQ